MKKIGIVMILGIMLFSTTIFTFAEEASAVKVDGSFDDWVDKPVIDDPKHDIKETYLDFLKMGYFCDEDYLYIHIERLSARKTDPWRLSVVVLNATKGTMLSQYPYDDQQVIYAPQFDIQSDNDGSNSSKDQIVEVSFEGNVLEKTLSADDDNKEIEFRVPLKEVGLDGMNKEVEFMVKSSIGQKRDEIDWIPDGGSVIVTAGPTFYELSTAVLFISVSLAAYAIYKKRKKVSQ